MGMRQWGAAFQKEGLLWRLWKRVKHAPSQLRQAGLIMFPMGELLVSHSVSVRKIAITSDQSYWRRPKCRPSLYEPTSPLFDSCIHTRSRHTQRWLVQTSLPHKHTSLHQPNRLVYHTNKPVYHTNRLSGLVCGYKLCSDHIMQTGLSQ